MLIEFRVRNFRSIKDEQVLSLVAGSDKTKRDTHVISSTAKVIPDLLRSAVLYGPNASGKSNLLHAIAYMRAVVLESAGLQPEQTFNVQPFRLDSETKTQPSEFELTFAVDGVRYQYGFSLTPTRIHEEWLLVYKAPKPQQWFSRKYDPETNSDVYELGTYLTGQKKVWQEATRPNSLFLSVAIQLNSESLYPVFDWIRSNLVTLGVNAFPPDATTRRIQDPLHKKAIVDFLAAADINISDVQVETQKGVQHAFQFNAATGKAESFQTETDILMPKFVHECEHGREVFDLHEESLGTQRLYSFVGPFLEILSNGHTLFVDELDSSLHTLLVRRLLSLFQNPHTNPKGAQLIFTTHDTALLNQAIFRRDQVWFTEKDLHNATRLYPLTDFSPRKNEALEDGYLEGRYGAIPFLKGLDF